MYALARVLHVSSVGLWFGTAVFFSFVVGLTLFATFERLSSLPREQRPLWLPLPDVLDRDRPSPAFPDPLRKEQGSRLAGAAVGPMFLWYYGLQVACGVVALLTALAWTGAGRAGWFRVGVIALALAGAGLGWWVERQVEGLRVVRSATSDAVLEGRAPATEADAIRAEFGRWHTISLGLNLLTVGLVLIALVLAAFLPAPRGAADESPTGRPAAAAPLS